MIDNDLKPGDICLFQPGEKHEDADDGRPHYLKEIGVVEPELARAALLMSV